MTSFFSVLLLNEMEGIKSRSIISINPYTKKEEEE
jgi:hypothetical protein